jgi:hypothetical protein
MHHQMAIGRFHNLKLGQVTARGASDYHAGKVKEGSVAWTDKTITRIFPNDTPSMGADRGQGTDVSCPP